MRAAVRPIVVAMLLAGCAAGLHEERAVADEPDWPRPPDPPAPPAPIERRLGKNVCVGKPGPKERPHRAACCYPARELILRPLRAAFPALRACYDARTKRDAQGRVDFKFRIEKDGSIPHVCASEHSTMDDEGAVRCMLDAIHKVRYPAVTDADVDFCGLMTLSYPVTFEP